MRSMDMLEQRPIRRPATTTDCPVTLDAISTRSFLEEASAPLLQAPPRVAQPERSAQSLNCSSEPGTPKAATAGRGSKNKAVELTKTQTPSSRASSQRGSFEPTRDSYCRPMVPGDSEKLYATMRSVQRQDSRVRVRLRRSRQEKLKEKQVRSTRPLPLRPLATTATERRLLSATYQRCPVGDGEA
jgi:hypothetical protein